MAEHVDSPLLHFLLSDVAGFLVVVAIALLATSVVYRVMPNVRRRWRPLTPGSVFAVVAWVILSLGFRIYVDGYGSYNETYGALAGVIVLMIWLYLTGMTFFFGAQMNAVILRHVARPKGESPSRGPLVQKRPGDNDG